MAIRLTGAAVGFTLSLSEAARLVDLTPDALVDLTRSGCVGAYVAAASETTERPPLRFDPVHMAALQSALAAGVAEDAQARVVSVVAAVSAGLRAFLREAAPSDSARRAVEERRPLLATARDGHTYAHVRLEHVAETAVGFAASGTRVVLSMSDTVAGALKRLGCQEVRGLRAAGDAKQSWRNWWRVPLSIWSLAEEDALRVDDFPALGGMRSEG